MNAARIGVLVLAIVAAGLAAFLARGLVTSNDEPVEPKLVEAPTTEVLVAGSNLQLGQRVAGGDLRWQRWPDTSMNGAYITRNQNPAAVEDYMGSVARASILNGEPVTADKLVTLTGAGFMSALIEPGMRAAAISITPETSAGGFILPNDRVDVVDVARGQTILRNIRVLAIDQRFDERAGEQVAVGKTATLELTPVQVEVISVAQAEGNLGLSLRSMAEQDLAGNETTAAEGGSVVKIVRYGTAQNVRVK
ncbi:Flp pilus assembly protein CpaB [Parvibaculum sp.]|uniref:Flp pilus assembly protein CpaB n=1 Tax=Parvibaculum sp. TaxID=2024848 RepID=UPI002731677B|nr:Flp pilus assembly protein CpaB [Parvibaculum sp.]MDP1626317.1 Flp pilus assembly protein CpaB [Parvibaculum sp.]MDP2151292.1 Flp pilus assembly protein CpaB [Parvibaculum sp.]MDP3327133.1 Flp pilus assembly protein CpaB [Parvibaculum sp.]